MKPSNNPSSKTTQPNSMRLLAVAGVFAVAVGLYLFIPQGDNLSPSNNITLSTRGGSGDDKEHASLRIIREGMEYYNNKEYDKAIPIFQEYLEKNKEASDYYQIQFYLAVSFLNQGETERSAKLLEQLTKVSDKMLQEDAKWYLSLAYARTGENEKAKEQLQDLVNSERYAAKAEKILDPNKTKVALK